MRKIASWLRRGRSRDEPLYSPSSPDMPQTAGSPAPFHGKTTDEQDIYPRDYDSHRSGMKGRSKNSDYLNRMLGNYTTSTEARSLSSDFSSSPLDTGARTPEMQTDTLSLDRDICQATAVLYTTREVYRSNAYIPALVIRPNDIAGDRRMIDGQDGLMYYDPAVESIRDAVKARGLDPSDNEASLQFLDTFVRKAVRIFQLVPNVVYIRGGPYYRYLGDFFLIKTDETLSKEMWQEVREETRNDIIKRFVDTTFTPDEDPNPGQQYSPKNVRKLYDAGGVMPLILLKPTGRPSAEPTRMAHLPEFIHNINSDDDASVYSQESAEDPNPATSRVVGDAPEAFQGKDDPMKSGWYEDTSDEESACSQDSALRAYTEDSRYSLPSGIEISEQFYEDDRGCKDGETWSSENSDTDVEIGVEIMGPVLGDAVRLAASIVVRLMHGNGAQIQAIRNVLASVPDPNTQNVVDTSAIVSVLTRRYSLPEDDDSEGGLHPPN